MKHQITIEAIKKAIISREKSYKGVRLPSPQTAGTCFQQSSYAERVARELYEKHFRNN